MVFEPFLKKLAERGHNVTVASFFPEKNRPPNYKDISFVGIAPLRLESYDLGDFENERLLYKIPRVGRNVKILSQLNPFKTSTVTICARLVKYKPLLDALKENYDVVLVENFIGDCMLGLLHAFGITAPIIALLSCSSMPWTFERIGANDNPSYVPVIVSPFGTQMSFLDRVENTIVNIIVNDWYHQEVQASERMIIEKEYGTIPDLRELAKNTSLVISYGYHPFTGAKPLVPGLVEVGGMHLSSERKPLPLFIEKFLNESSDGVILFSFGSHIKTKSIPKYKEQILLKALSKLKQRVIWKFEDSGDEGTLIGNVLKVKWLPQYDLLRHEKVVALITHGGLLSLTEAMSSGKPSIVIPFFGDQPANAAAVSEAGVGLVLSYQDISEESFYNALQRVLSEEIRTNAQRVSKIWQDRQSAPLDTAIFWTEHVIRWKSPQLYSHAKNLNVDIIAEFKWNI
ncbi:unnamed protein product, partial [Brenthis ino]